ncbi:MAG TPA: VOC family protein [Actinomycetota bacterium]|nr:VOC family protein [Actinomycetota bacterium]
MIDHIGLNVPDLAAAKSYYDVVTPVLGYEPFFAADEQFSYRPAGGKPGTTVFFYAAPLESEYVRKHVGLEHLAFRARTRSQVDDAHAKALEAGSRILYSPRLFPQYHESYYAAFWFDPHGFLLEIVCHKPEAAA